jgi:F-type H+-transporting ATPase subunit a
MEKLHHELLIVRLANDLFGSIVGRPIPDYLVMTVVVVLFLVVLAAIVRSQLRVENPGRLQIVMEDIVGFVVGLLKENIGPTGPKYLALIGTLFLFILTANLLGKVPGFMSPTASINVTLGCALTGWVYYHFEAIRAVGLVEYFKHFLLPAGAPWWVAIIYLPVEIISHLSRIMSLSIRLFGNIFGEELVVLILASLVPFLVPLPIMVLGMITGTLQAFIFALLTIIYLAAFVHADHAHEDEAHGAHGEAHAPAHA